MPAHDSLPANAIKMIALPGECKSVDSKAKLLRFRQNLWGSDAVVAQKPQPGRQAGHILAKNTYPERAVWAKSHSRYAVATYCGSKTIIAGTE